MYTRAYYNLPYMGICEKIRWVSKGRFIHGKLTFLSASNKVNINVGMDEYDWQISIHPLPYTFNAYSDPLPSRQSRWPVVSSRLTWQLANMSYGSL